MKNKIKRIGIAVSIGIAFVLVTLGIFVFASTFPKLFVILMFSSMGALVGYVLSIVISEKMKA